MNTVSRQWSFVTRKNSEGLMRMTPLTNDSRLFFEKEPL